MFAPRFGNSKDFAVGFQIVPPGTGGDLHTHDIEQEAFFIYQGHGKATLGDDEFEIGPETAFVAPPGIPHKIFNSGLGELRFVWIFSPPLPSQQLK